MNDAHRIRLLGHTDQGGRPDGVQVMVAKGHAYVGHMFSDGVTVIDVADPHVPKPVNFVACPANTRASHIQVHDGLLLAVNAVNFGGFIFAWITVAGAARDGAEYMMMSSASAGSPTAATAGQVTALVTSDVASLLNKASVLTAVCTNNTTAANGCTALFDPEAPTYTLATVDVTYTYNPFIPLFSFPKLGISATLPSSSIHRKAVVRMMQ